MDAITPRPPETRFLPALADALKEWFPELDRRAVPVAAVPEGASSGGVAVSGDEELWERVRRLPAKQRTAVYCRSVLGMPYDELAVLLESSEEAARRSVHEGLKRLREELTDD